MSPGFAPAAFARGRRCHFSWCLFHLTKGAPDRGRLGLRCHSVQARPLNAIIVLILPKVSLGLGPAALGDSEPHTSLTSLTLTSPSPCRLQSFSDFQLHSPPYSNPTHQLLSLGPAPSLLTVPPLTSRLTRSDSISKFHY